MEFKFVILFVLVVSGSCCVPVRKSAPPRENELGTLYNVESSSSETASPIEYSLDVNYSATPNSESPLPELTTIQPDEADSERAIENLFNPQDKALGGFNIPSKTNLIIAPATCPEGYQKDHAGKCRAPFGSRAESPIATSGISQVNIIGLPCLSGFRQDANGNCRKVWGF